MTCRRLICRGRGGRPDQTRPAFDCSAAPNGMFGGGAVFDDKSLLTL